jgi:Fe-Mn family superoxide dismutase
MAHEVPALPYDYNALEPHIDEQTMRIHHDKHHAAYVNNLNTALEKHAQLQQKTVDDLVRGINSVPEDIRTAVRNNGGGHVNHTMFWQIMGPGKGGAPSGAAGVVRQLRQLQRAVCQGRRRPVWQRLGVVDRCRR